MCVGIPHEKLVGRICNTWGRISCIWLEKKIFFRELWKLFTDNVMIFLCSHYDDVFLRDNPAESVVCLLNECAACASDIKKLLRFSCPADRPESCSGSSGHDYAITVVYVHYIMWFCVSLINI